MSSNKDVPTVGDLYADNDPRAVGRVVEVIELQYQDKLVSGGLFVSHCPVLDSVRVRVVQDRRRHCLRSSIGKETRISVERLLSSSNNRGYRRIESLDQA